MNLTRSPKIPNCPAANPKMPLHPAKPDFPSLT